MGNLTKNVGFYTVINRGYGSLDLLDAFITLRFSDKLRLRVGRMKTPYLYEYFSIAEGDLIAPERSLFAGNLALNRQMGFMFLGELFDSRVSYATGLYNGPRRSFQDLNSAKDIIGNVTIRPFLNSERFKALNYLNIGGSWDVGYQNNSPPQPVYFETANDQTPNNATSLSPTFLHLNNNVIELGERVQWGGHLVWYYKSLFLMAEYGGAVGIRHREWEHVDPGQHERHRIHGIVFSHGRAGHAPGQHGQAAPRFQLRFLDGEGRSSAPEPSRSMPVTAP